MNVAVRWLTCFIIGGGLVWETLCLRRQSLQGSAPSPDFVSSFAVYATLTTLFAAVALTLMFYVAYRGSRIPPPRPTWISVPLAWVILIVIALNCTERGIGEQAFRWDELFANLSALTSAVALTGVLMAVRLEKNAEPAPPNPKSKAA